MVSVTHTKKETLNFVQPHPVSLHHQTLTAAAVTVNIYLLTESKQSDFALDLLPGKLLLHRSIFTAHQEQQPSMLAR